ncbi:hypothetical protein EI427_00660 [Flammeovirga pectinis]|uniref:Uncharacterized protein n=1 Tax=Flammeovirga pectinis TaxID=2494373 RepID=A0A3S9NXU8_9BACT|nr:hypothetical protein [Flammeovirga pectinis]AZQ60772.1 hypothetical protein EI427_00660 [Flammeovirga pectinis]
MKLLKLIFLLFLPIFTLKAQITEKGYSTFKCFYTYQYQPFKQDTTKFQDKFLLICNDDFSIFENYTSFLFSKALSDDFENRNLNGNSSVFSILATNTKDLQEPDANNFSVMKDYTTKEATYIYNLGYIANCTFTENYGELNWTITDQSKIIEFITVNFL